MKFTVIRLFTVDPSNTLMAEIDIVDGPDYGLQRTSIPAQFFVGIKLTIGTTYEMTIKATGYQP